MSTEDPSKGMFVNLIVISDPKPSSCLLAEEKTRVPLALLANSWQSALCQDAVSRVT